MAVLCVGCQLRLADTCQNCGGPALDGQTGLVDERRFEILRPVGSGTWISERIPRRGPNLVLEAFLLSPATGAATVDTLDCAAGGQLTRCVDTLGRGYTLTGYDKWQVKGVLAEVAVQITVSSGIWSVWGTFTDAATDRVASTVTGEFTAGDFKATGLTGATAVSRHVGATGSGAPSTGTFNVGDYVVDQSGTMYVCTVSGSPGTWAEVGSTQANGLTVTAGGETITAGGLTITAGGLRVTAGNVGVGGAPASTWGMLVNETLTGGVTQIGMYSLTTGDSGATTAIEGVRAQISTAASAFTCTTVAGFHAVNPTRGAGSTITSAYGLLVDGIAAGNTNNYGVYINAPSGGSGSNIGLYNLGSVITNGSGTQFGTFGGSGGTKQTVTGAKGGNAALTSLMAALVAYNLVTDSTT
jgi:hypothetical protein